MFEVRVSPYHAHRDNLRMIVVKYFDKV